MSEAEREEAYLNKMLNRGKDTATVKKNVFGGGLEAARAREQGGGKPVVTAPPPVVTSGGGGYSTAAYNKPPPGRTNSNSNQPQSRYIPPPLEAEVVEVSLPFPGQRNYEPPDESSIAINSGISREELARREEERLGKNIGKFAIQPKVDNHPPPPPQQQRTTTANAGRTTSYGTGGQSYNPPPTHGGQSYSGGGPSHAGGSSASFSGHNPSASHSNVSRGSDYTYPDFQIGVITPVDGSTTVLPLSPFGCNANELTLHVRQNGKLLEVRRSVTQKGAPRTEVKNINLPFQVLPSTTTASYNPNKNGGELAIFFGKPQTSSNSRETEVCRFTVYADSSSNETRVPIGVSQSPDSFVFRPERGSMYDTDFTVVLTGSVLEFRSVCTFEDDEGTKTVNAKQTVQLPITPSPDQIESVGDQVTVWINPQTSTVSSNVADFQVHISAGH